MKQDCLRCLLLLGAVSIIAVTIILVGLVQEWTNEKLGVVIEMGLALAVVGLVLLACDWNALGPNVAVHHSTLAVATALLIAVPLGLIIFALIEWEPITGLVILCIIAAGAPFLAFGFTGCCFGSVVAYAIIMLSGTMKNASKIDPVLATRLSILGIALVLVSVYMPVRKSITLRRIEDWTGMVEVDPRSDEFRERAQFFAESCDLRADKYPFRLGIVSLYGPSGRHGSQREDTSSVYCSMEPLGRVPRVSSPTASNCLTTPACLVKASTLPTLLSRAGSMHHGKRQFPRHVVRRSLVATEGA